ncbi:hypothetical protein F5Y01DRAFT_315219 [Xylaria sp. FL0043]|nr:hypothetical protein F5Y01DRAFT_315219 [Xylaria sp. FL0043]
MAPRLQSIFGKHIWKIRVKDKDEDKIGPLAFPCECGGTDSGVDLVFVHGLRGSRVKTWSKADIFWPRDLLRDDLKMARVITWGYDADIANIFAPAGQKSLFGHANTLLRDLARHRSEITRPIVFICHSLGGLVVKEALISSASYDHSNRFPQLAMIYRSTVGVVFMGTPHRGSSLESYGEIVVKIAKLSGRRPNAQLLQTLRPNSHILEKLRNDFTTISNNMVVVCFYEELPTIKWGLIVPEASASYEGFNVSFDSIHADHEGMVKFSERVEGYEKIIGCIRDIIDAKVQKTKLVNKAVEARKDKILKTLEFPTIRVREEQIEEAHTETCSWVWDDRLTGTPSKPCDFISWLRSTEKFFWISGKAGCGKSTLMKYIYNHPKTRTELERSAWTNGKDLILLGCFIYERGGNDQKSREGMLRSILFQVLSKWRDLIPKVFSPWRFFDNPESELEILPGFLDWNSLSRMFVSLLTHLQDSRLCLFLDGLDEYRMAGREDQYTEEQLDLVYDGDNEDDAWGRSTWITEGHKEIARFLCQLETHSNVKICFSSRELAIFEHEFRSFPRTMVHTHTEEAIAKYCEDRLTKEAPDLEDLSKFEFKIVEKSSGVFLWVRLVVDLLVDGYVNGDYAVELWKEIEKLPPRLGGRDGLYMHMMRNVDPKHLPESKRLFQLVILAGMGGFDIITLFLAEQGHLQDGSTQELRVSRDEYDLRDWDQWEDERKRLQRRLKSRCGLLLEGDERVHFMHQTAEQFISRTYLWPKIFRNATGFNTEEETNLALMSGWIRRLKRCSEAVVTTDNVSVDTEAKSTAPVESLNKKKRNIAIEPYRYLSNYKFAGFFMQNIVLSAGGFGRELISADNVSYIVKLLDELDCVGEKLTCGLRDFKDAVYSYWTDVYFEDEPRAETFLDFAILCRIKYYVKAKLQGRQFSDEELSHLLVRAIWMSETVRPFKPHYDTHAETVEILFQKGADPNSQNAEIDSIMKAKAFRPKVGWTAWTFFLEQASVRAERHSESEVDISTMKVFLKYGADPAASWDWLKEKGIYPSANGDGVNSLENTLVEYFRSIM